MRYLLLEVENFLLEAIERQLLADVRQVAQVGYAHRLSPSLF
jgi:hypothetical protein